MQKNEQQLKPDIDKKVKLSPGDEW